MQKRSYESGSCVQKNCAVLGVHPRISVQEAHTKTKANQALLVCAYEDEAKCRMLNLDGSISFATLQSRAASLPKTQEIIFY
jgi:hypothetical protein